ncbi:MAG: PQQ-binding-like beta-propeller repeat protein [Oscillospiraceae bacterium]
MRKNIALQAIVLALALAIFAFIEVNYIRADPNALQNSLSSETSNVTPTSAEETPAATPTPVVSPTPTPEPVFSPHAVEGTQPDKLIASTEVEADGELVDDYQAEKSIDFGYGDNYTDLRGVTTFRGDNFRSGAVYGTADIVAKKFGDYWTRSIGALTSYTGYTWTGCGWTGQPLIVEWDKATRAVMNMYDWAKEQGTLVEVVHATMDGHVYFTELTTGKPTRDSLYLGFTFKGAGSLDPRGYPILYVGAGYYGATSAPRALAISLIDGSVLFDLGVNETFALRQWNMFDSAPLVSAETDQLIWPGESGILYIVDMNTQYDEAAGTLTVDPKVTKWRYNGVRTGSQYWLGMEDSAVAWQGYLFVADNGGNLMCLDLDTLKLVWVQDVLDDTNCTPVLEMEDGHPYIYISTSFHAGWRAWEGQTATIPIWKIDAETGEIVWQVDYDCQTVKDVSGGVQGTLACGKNKLADLIFVPVARTPGAGDGILSAISKTTGEVVWELHTQVYSWSSPVAVYDAEGNGYLIYCNSGGYMYLVDGLTGKILDDASLGSNIEASPAVYENTVVIGTRGQLIYGFQLT